MVIVYACLSRKRHPPLPTSRQPLLRAGEGRVLLPSVNTTRQKRVTNRLDRLPLQSTRMRSTVDSCYRPIWVPAPRANSILSAGTGLKRGAGP